MGTTINRESVKASLIAAGWEADRWGNLRKVRIFEKRDTGERLERLCRVKLGPRALRYEFRAEINKSKEWFKLSSGYYNKLKVDVHGNLRLGIHILNS